MGLESINFLFHSNELIEPYLISNTSIDKLSSEKFIYRETGKFWIDIKVQDDYVLSIRIFLGNPLAQVLIALDKLFLYLFDLNGSILLNLSSKQKYKLYNTEVKLDIRRSFMLEKKKFELLYAGYTAAISSDEFYKTQNYS